MARVRHLLLSFLAVVGLCFALGTASESVACPAQPRASAAMAHHNDGCGHRAPVTTHDAQLCPACLAVLPGLAVFAPHAFLPFAAFTSPIRPLAGVDPALDPPPPRAA